MRNVLITGATGGIGQSLVDVYYNNGYKIVATGTNIEKLMYIVQNWPPAPPRQRKPA